MTNRFCWPPRYPITRYSLTPLLVIAIAVAGLVFGREAAQNQIVETIGSMSQLRLSLGLGFCLDEGPVYGAGQYTVTKLGLFTESKTVAAALAKKVISNHVFTGRHASG